LLSLLQITAAEEAITEMCGASTLRERVREQLDIEMAAPVG